jgi:hypothetical protein
MCLTILDLPEVIAKLPKTKIAYKVVIKDENGKYSPLFRHLPEELRTEKGWRASNNVDKTETSKMFYRVGVHAFVNKESAIGLRDSSKGDIVVKVRMKNPIASGIEKWGYSEKVVVYEKMEILEEV